MYIDIRVKCSITPLIRINWKASHQDMQKIRILVIFFENRLHRQFAVLLLLFTVCTVPVTIYSMYCTCHYLQHVLYLLQFTVCTVPVTIYSMYCTCYYLQHVLYLLLFTVCTVPASKPFDHV